MNQRIIKLFKIIKTLSIEEHHKIKVVGSRPGILNDLCKIPKNKVDGRPPLRHILSTTGMRSYKIFKIFYS